MKNDETVIVSQTDIMKKTLTILALCFTLFILRGTSVNAENGHSLWLRMIPVQQEGRIMVDKNTDITETIVIAVDELTRYWRQSEQIILKTTKLPVVKEGFYIQKEGKSIYIMSPTDRGILYGTYELLRRQSLGTLNFDRRNTFVNFPIAQYRILNHWDNLNGTIERGFAGHSIFWNISLIDSHSTTILKEYARANASIGIKR